MKPFILARYIIGLIFDVHPKKRSYTLRSKESSKISNSLRTSSRRRIKGEIKRSRVVEARVLRWDRLALCHRSNNCSEVRQGKSCSWRRWKSLGPKMSIPWERMLSHRRKISQETFHPAKNNFTNSLQSNPCDRNNETYKIDSLSNQREKRHADFLMYTYLHTSPPKARIEVEESDLAIASILQ